MVMFACFRGGAPRLPLSSLSIRILVWYVKPAPGALVLRAARAGKIVEFSSWGSFRVRPSCKIMQDQAILYKKAGSVVDKNIDLDQRCTNFSKFLPAGSYRFDKNTTRLCVKTSITINFSTF